MIIGELIILGKPPPKPGDGHWSKVHKAKTEWTDYIGWQAKARRIPACKPGEKRRVTVTFYRPGVISDKDNAYARCKVPLDALKRAGLIEDDSPEHIDLKAYTVTAHKSRTTIILEAI